MWSVSHGGVGSTRIEYDDGNTGGARTMCRRMWLVAVWMVVVMASVSRANHDAKRLYDDLLLRQYNKLIRPVGNSSDGLTVHLGLRMAQLIDVDERNQIMTTNMWVIQLWKDFSLRWDPVEYGGVAKLYVPSEKIWLPDIVLYNNADGDYTVTLMTKATLSSQGLVTWEPPAIYKSYCDINVKFFPFDEQLCDLKFGSWSYDGTLVDIRHIEAESNGEVTVEEGIDIKNFYPSTEWDLLAVPAKKTNKYYPCCLEPYPDITFNISLRRKTLFYTINLLVPCLSINMLTCLTFYLPSDSGEKISLCITILLSLSMFQLLLMELIPATSITVPMMGKYIIFTMAMVSLSVFISVVTLNVNLRSAATSTMPGWTRKLFFDILPRLLFMKRSEASMYDEEESCWSDWHDQPTDMTRLNPCGWGKRDSHPENGSDPYGGYTLTSTFIGADTMWPERNLPSFCEACMDRRMRSYPVHIQKVLEGAAFIEKHHRDDDEQKNIKEDWRYVAGVLDRIFLWIYVSICTVGGASILLNAPMLYKSVEPRA